jgi:hypothetical protein
MKSPWIDASRPAASCHKELKRKATMSGQDRDDARFDAITARLIRREALRRAAEELNTTSGPGLEGVLARISAEVTAEAAEKVAEKRPANAG